jgi:hypothetical protein
LTPVATGDQRLAAITVRPDAKMAGKRGLRSANQFVNGPSPERRTTTRMRRERTHVGQSRSYCVRPFSGPSIWRMKSNFWDAQTARGVDPVLASGFSILESPQKILPRCELPHIRGGFPHYTESHCGDGVHRSNI